MRTLFCITAIATVSGAAEQKNIKVLSYSGPGAGMEDIDNQHMCFKKDIIPGVTIRGTKKTSIRSGDLDGYDVLLMPGGNPGPEVQNCDKQEVLSFMKRGGGYYGTCAGAMAACTWKSVDPVTGQFNPYNLSETAEPVGNDANGKPIFPKYTKGFATFELTEAVCHMFSVVGVEHNTLTPEGQKAFPNQKSAIDIDHHNGPSFTTEDGGIRLANYKGGRKNGEASIVGDTYKGTGGKVIIVSPHPEHPKLQNCDIVTYMAAYAAGLDVSEYMLKADEWEAWKQEHGKVYNGDEEDAYRRSVFEANMAGIPKLQKENPYAEFGATHLSDLTDEELPLGYIPSDVEMPEVPLGNVTVADSKDWTDTCCTPIKDQGHCGSCWAFSAVEQIESMYTLKKQSTIVLAPQELVDCKGDKSQRNGCGGGYPAEAFDVIKKLGGICAETDYPYTAKNGRCSFQASTAKVKVLSHGSVSSESKMKDYVGSTAPLSICHQTGGWSSYKSGIMTSCGSGGGHCTQIVGYGDGNGMTYWKVRNSWGSRFGEAGHIRIQYGKGLCGIKAGMTVDVGSADDSVLV